MQYLEARLVQIGLAAQNTPLENANNPRLPSLSESDCANMEAFLDQLLMVLPAIRIDLFQSNTKPDTPQSQNKTAQAPNDLVFELVLKKEGITATAILQEGEFVVQKGSLARGEYKGDRTSKSNYAKLWDKLVQQGILAEQGTNKVFTQSYAFPSTSAAGAVCNGYNTAGPTAWKVKTTGQTYKDWEAAQLAED